MKGCYAFFGGIAVSLMLIMGTITVISGINHSPTIISDWWVINELCGSVLVFGGVLFVCMLIYELLCEKDLNKKEIANTETERT